MLAGVMIVVSVFDMGITRSAILTWYAQQGYSIQIGVSSLVPSLVVKADPHWFGPIFPITVLGIALKFGFIGLLSYRLMGWARQKNNGYLEGFIRGNWKFYAAYMITIFLLYLVPVFGMLVTGDYSAALAPFRIMYILVPVWSIFLVLGMMETASRVVEAITYYQRRPLEGETE